MKRSVLILIGVLLMFSLFAGCQQEQTDANNSQPVAEPAAANGNEADYVGIQQVIDTQIQAINAHDGDLYLTTINPENGTYYTEAQYFAHKLSTANYQDYSLKLEDVKAVSPEEAILTLNQQYKQNGQVNQVTYQAHFIKQGDQWLDDDVAFEIAQVGELIVRYMPEVANVDQMIGDIEQSLKNVEAIFPESTSGPVEIKLYSDQELLRQKTDFGIEWLFTGWAEQGHAIKAYTGQTNGYSYEGLFTHELIHKLTLAVSKGNMPIWLAEGLAIHYGTSMVDGGNYIEVGKSTADAMRMSMVAISRLNMETMSDRASIMAYYGAAGMMVDYLSQTYGDAAVFKIYQDLGQYPYNDISSEPNWYAISDQRLSEVIPKVFDKTFEELSEEYLQWYDTLYQ